jgi:hypothetical protein
MAANPVDQRTVGAGSLAETQVTPDPLRIDDLVAPGHDLHHVRGRRPLPREQIDDENAFAVQPATLDDQVEGRVTDQPA